MQKIWRLINFYFDISIFILAQNIIKLAYIFLTSCGFSFLQSYNTKRLYAISTNQGPGPHPTKLMGQSLKSSPCRSMPSGPIVNRNNMYDGV